MTYIITDPCVGTCDTACTEVCPVDCIHGPDDQKALEKKQKTLILMQQENSFILIQKNVLIVERVNQNALLMQSTMKKKFQKSIKHRLQPIMNILGKKHLNKFFYSH